MIRFEQIQNLKDQGLYDGLVKSGIISTSVNYWFEIYNFYKTKLTVYSELSNTKTLAYQETEDAFGCSEDTVRRSIKYMES